MPPKKSMITTKVQKRIGDICLFLFVPLVNEPRHDAPQFIEFFLVVDHLMPGQTRYRVVLAQENRLLGADFFAQPAVNAADHVDFELLRIFFDLSPSALLRNFAWDDRYRARRAYELAHLTCYASLAPVLVLDQG